MTQEILFAQALGLPAPWYIEEIKFTKGESNSLLSGGQLDIIINFTIGSKFLSDNQEICAVHDTVSKTWRHIDFFQHMCYIHARVPRIKLPDNSVKTVVVPWAKSGSGFTLLFEAMSMFIVKEGMSLNSAGRTLKEDGRVIGRIIRNYVEEAKQTQPLESFKVVGIDEVSIQKGHKYLTILSDSEHKKVVGIGVGKDRAAVIEALEEMDNRFCDFDSIRFATIDLSRAYISATLSELPQAKIVYDRFHVESLLSKAVDEVRRQEQSMATELKKTRYLWLRNEDSLSKRQLKKVHYLSKCFPTIGEAYRLKEQLKQIYNSAGQIGSIKDLKEWMKLAEASKIKPILQFVNTIKSHWSGIITYFKKQYTNAFAEQINSTIQLIKRIARGYRNIDNFKTMIYFKLGGLHFDNI